jgi:hypothetical protein
MARNPVRSPAARRSAPSLIADLANLLKDLAKGVFDPYRPELHYMRGAGPRWHAKHNRARAAFEAVPALSPHSRQGKLSLDVRGLPQLFSEQFRYLNDRGAVIR